ncbi:Amidase [Rhizoctonia solani]|uniref:Amidase n=1 Tax=Rhizoctonia solani TaxID=456999 RepID=A0A8H7M1T3_9AGAM|nr:Amidase [Rhizoctonia solani]
MVSNEHQSVSFSSLSHTANNDSRPPETSWEISAARKRDDRANRLKPYAHWSLAELTPPQSHNNVIPLVHARLTDRERSFLASDVTDLAQRLATRECTALEVTTAFCKAAYAAQELTNCLTEVMFEQALGRAQELDEHISTSGKVVGPLHGVPISIKDHISIKGEDTATGFVAWAGRTIAEEDATVVRILRQAGAIIYVKTTNPQSVFAFETLSNIYGHTTNPYNRDLTPGGSSGGEAALAACRGSLLGVGTDIGALLGPSAWCGLYGLKPSSHRLPASGILAAYKGMENIVGVLGPMAHSARDLELFCRVISDYEPWTSDFSTLPIPWNSTIVQHGGNDKLVIGLFIDDGVVEPHPPIIERLNKTREALITAGHEVIDWVPMDHAQAFELIPAIPPIAQILPDPSKANILTVSQSWDANYERDQFRARALKHWNDTALRSKSGRPVDAVLCPVAPTLAAPHGTTRWIGYTSYWNLLDLPAVVFPSGKPLQASSWASASHSPRDRPRNPFDEFVRAQWNPETFDGAPVGLQLVGRRWQEEKLLAVLKHVEDAVARFEK